MYILSLKKIHSCVSRKNSHSKDNCPVLLVLQEVRMEPYQSAVILLLLFGSCCGSGGGLGTDLKRKCIAGRFSGSFSFFFVLPRVGKQTFFKVRKFLCSFRYCKSANFLDVTVRKSQVRKFLLLIRQSHTRKFLQILHNSVSKQS
jgi:hypothetical protein